MRELVYTGHPSWLAIPSRQSQHRPITKAKIRCYKSPKNAISLEVKQEVAHRIIARRCKKCVVDIEAERRPPEITKVAA